MDGGLRAWKRVMTPGSISAILPFAETSLSRTAANTLMTAAPSASSVGVDSMKKERRGGRGEEEREEVFGGGRGFKVFKGLWMDIRGFFGESLDRSISGVSQMSKGVLLCSQLFSQFSRP